MGLYFYECKGLLCGDRLCYLLLNLIPIFLFLKPQIANVDFKMAQNVQENATLRSKIAQSPDKVQVSSSFDY